MASISEAANGDLRRTIDKVTSDPTELSGVVFASVNKDGDTVFSHASGTRGSDTKEPMTLESVFWIASCTKLVDVVACMQLVEQGEIDLDDADKLEGIAPELKSVKILKSVGENGRPELVEKTNRITLRMLLTHTAGFGYSFFDPVLKRYAQPLPFDGRPIPDLSPEASELIILYTEFSGYAGDLLKQPLLSEPGTAWQYGINIDWAGTVVERISGLKLNDYFQKNVCDPLGITDISMFPDTDMIRRLASMHQREADGSLRTRDHLLRRPLIADESEQSDIYNSAGAGCFGKPTEYCQILATLLNDGTSPRTGNTILKKESVDKLLENQIEQFPNFGRHGIAAAKPDQTNPIPDMYHQEGDPPQGWNLAGFHNIEPCSTGRSANSTYWAGLANLFWFLDREKGVAGMIASQILPFGDPNVLSMWLKIEAGLYQALGY